MCSSLAPVVYIPKYFIPHAVSLRQTFVHCARFLVAAIRRCRPRVSVTLWGVALSRPLPVIALVGHYPTNKLIGRRLLSRRAVTPFSPVLTPEFTRYYPGFRRAIPHQEVDSYVLRTRPPLFGLRRTARLACLKHTASVHPEPGSNSQKN